MKAHKAVVLEGVDHQEKNSRDGSHQVSQRSGNVRGKASSGSGQGSGGYRPGMGPGIVPGIGPGASARLPPPPALAPHAVQVGLPSGKLVPQVWQKLIVFSPYSSISRPMVAQLAGNLRGHRLRQGVAGTSLLPGRCSVHDARDTVSTSVQHTIVENPESRFVR